MKAPETIYLATTDEVQNLDNSFIGIAHNNPDDIIEPIEYVRKDAFIEKIENYLNSKLYDWVRVTNPDQRSHPNVIPKKDFIEDIKNYMKGE